MIGGPDYPANAPFSVVDVNPELLPSAAVVYSGVDLVVATPEELRDDEPLRQWVEAGGLVVVAGLVEPADRSAPYSEIAPPSAYGDMIPVTPVGLTKLPASAILGPRFADASGDVDVVRCAPKPGARVLASHESIPLVVERRVGLGRVIYTAFDPDSPALAEEQYGCIRLWQGILQASVADRGALPSVNDPGGYLSLADATSRGMEVDPPGIGLIAGFLGLYVLLLVPVNYLLLKKMRRKELAWGTVPALVIVFFVAAYALGSSGREKEPKLNCAWVAEMAANSDTVRWAGYAGLFSPSRTQHDITFADPRTLASDSPYLGGGNAFPALKSIREDRQLLLSEVDAYMWSTRTLAVRGISRIDGRVSAELTTDGTRVRGTVTNGLPFTLSECVLCGDRFKAEIGTLSPGQTVRIDRTFEDQAGIKLQVHDYDLQTSADLKTRVKEAVLRRQAPVLSQPGQLVLLGWAEHPMWDLRVDSRRMASEEAGAVFVHTYPTWEAGPGGRIAGVVRWRPAETNTYQDWDNPGGGTHLPLGVPPIMLGQELTTVQFQLPVDARLCDYSDLALEFHVAERSYDPNASRPQVDLRGPLGIEVYDWSSQSWRSVGAPDSTGIVRLPIRPIPKVIGPGSVVRVRMGRSERLSGDIGIFDLHLAFEGRSRR